MVGVTFQNVVMFRLKSFMEWWDDIQSRSQGLMAHVRFAKIITVRGGVSGSPPFTSSGS